MKVVVGVSVCCDVALLSWWLFSPEPLVRYDAIWASGCVCGHVAIYIAALTHSPSLRTNLCEFADWLLWVSMVGSVFLTSVTLFRMSMVLLAVVVILYYANNKTCLLTGRQWDTVAALTKLRLLRGTGTSPQLM